ncbi:MAG TPA: SAM-dependent methyltransferase [Acidimicrobiales bacterium]
MDDAADRTEDGSFPIDHDVPRLARVRNVITGGGANFEADRRAAESLAAAAPTGFDGLRGVVEAMHKFVLRGVRAVADESDVRQFLHIGTATPSTGIVHEHVLPLVPDAKIVYASYDTTTLAHVHGLRRDRPDGAVGHIHSPFDDPDRILQGSAEMLDLEAPIAVVLPTSLNIVTDEVAQKLMDSLRSSLVGGSYVVMAQSSLDIYAEGAAEVVELLNQMLDEPYVVRTEREIAHHLEGFDLLEPGLVPVEQWRPDGDPRYLPEGQLIPVYGAVGIKP